jgi:hypothetical protein
MKIYVWEGKGISRAYHDDGTLVVLAESPEQARDLVRAACRAGEQATSAWQEKYRAVARDMGYETGPGFWKFWQTEQGKALSAETPPGDESYFDGYEEALNREPDRVVGIDTPTWVAFNGGGYD